MANFEISTSTSTKQTVDEVRNFSILKLQDENRRLTEELQKEKNENLRLRKLNFDLLSKVDEKESTSTLKYSEINLEVEQTEEGSIEKDTDEEVMEITGSSKKSDGVANVEDLIEVEKVELSLTKAKELIFSKEDIEVMNGCEIRKFLEKGWERTEKIKESLLNQYPLF